MTPGPTCRLDTNNTSALTPAASSWKTSSSSSSAWVPWKEWGATMTTSSAQWSTNPTNSTTYARTMSSTEFVHADKWSYSSTYPKDGGISTEGDTWSTSYRRPNRTDEYCSSATDKYHGYDDYVCGDTPLISAIVQNAIGTVQQLIETGAQVNKGVYRNNNMYRYCTPLTLASESGLAEIIVLLLNAQANINQTGSSNFDTPLLLAVQNNHVDIVRLLIANNGDVSAPDAQNQTPLMRALSTTAALHQEVTSTSWPNSVVSVLLDNGADVNRCAIAVAMTPLMRAVEANNASLVEALIAAHASVNMVDGVGDFPLLCAVENRHASLIATLTSHGAHVNRENLRDVLTPLNVACSMNDNTALVAQLLQCQADVNLSAGKHTFTPIMLAVEINNIDVVKMLIDAKADVNKGTRYGYSPLSLALRWHRVDIVTLLITSKVDVNLSFHNARFTPIMVAIKYDTMDLMQLLLDASASIMTPDSLGATPLTVAIEFGNLDAVDLLLQGRAELYPPQTTVGMSPLMVALTNTKDSSVIQHLVTVHGIDLNWVDSQYDTALRYATRRDKRGVLKRLLDLRADVNHCVRCPESGWRCYETALGIACEHGYMEACDMLLEADACVNQCSNRYWDSPLMIAVKTNYFYIMTRLVDKKASVNKDNAYGVTSLHVAIEKDNLRCVEQLIQWRADVNGGILADGDTHLLASCRRGDAKILRLLLEQADHEDGSVNIGNECGFTPLMVASRRGHAACVELLLERNADVTVRNFWEQTAVMCAMDGNEGAIARRLMQEEKREVCERPHSGTRRTGTCGLWLTHKNMGFVTPEDGGCDVVVLRHVTRFPLCRSRLWPGDRVEFEACYGDDAREGDKPVMTFFVLLEETGPDKLDSTKS
eukprot:GEMP01003045.1.p1 GENE.GEMP01003045.1~~GEMP01003045.1.p1  ORF type:complete len:881 (+),score=178.89 GEMP01003045.1:71-2713(+)